MEKQKQLNAESYTVGIIYVKPLEMNAISVMLDEVHKHVPLKLGDNNQYHLGRIGKHNVAIAGPPIGAQGKAAISDVVGRIRLTFWNIQVGLLVGIGGGVPRLPEHDVRLGDVVVGAPEYGPAVVQYDLGKQTPTEIKIARTLNKPPALLLSVVSIVDNELITADEGAANFFDTHLRRYASKPLMKDFSQRPSAPDHLFESAFEHEEKTDCNSHDASRHVKRDIREQNLIQIHYSTILSGDLVMKSGRHRDQLSAKYYNALCFEMEAAGVMDTFPCLVVKGICDYCDSHKNKEWQKFAAATAAAYARQILLSMSETVVENLRSDQIPTTGFLVPLPRHLNHSDNQACLDSLSFPAMDARYNSITGAHSGTCDWLQDNIYYKQWRDPKLLYSHNNVLWIKGKAGAGKSTLMKRAFLAFQKSSKGHTIAKYFFTARGAELEKTPMGMLRSLIFQLLASNEAMLGDFLQIFGQKMQKHGEQRSWSWQIGELQDFLLHQMEKTQQTNILLIIDALDECKDSDVEAVVKFLEAISITAAKAGTSLRICLSSRHYPTIGMKKCQDLNLDITQKHDEDIKTYIGDTLISGDRALENRVLKKSGGVFMWVILVVSILNRDVQKGNITALQRSLEEIPKELDDLFFNILKKDNQNRPLTVLMLQWVLFSQDVLRPEELYFAVISGSGEAIGSWDRVMITDDVIRRYINNVSCGLVEVRHDGKDSRAQFIHQSVPDFLTRQARLQQLDPLLKINQVGISHDRLAKCCLVYLSMEELKRAVKNVARHFRRQERINIFQQFPFIGYAAQLVFQHLDLASVADVSQKETVAKLQSDSEDSKWIRYVWTLVGQRRKSYDRLMFAEGVTEIATLLYIFSAEYCVNLLRVALDLNTSAINSSCGQFGTPIQAAILDRTRNSNQVLELVKILLENGADINAQGGLYGNALQAAALNEKHGLEVIKLLLEKDANVNAQGGYYGNALQAAALNDHYAPEFVRLLLKSDANVNAQGGEYGNALQAAALNERVGPQLVEFLTENDANVNAQGGYYGNALQAAALNETHGPELIKLLLEKDANVNAQGGYYGNALQAAAAAARRYSVDSFEGYQVSLKIAQLLVNAGADVNAQGGWHGSALVAAIERENKKTEEYLRSVGAKEEHKFQRGWTRHGKRRLG